MNKKKIKDKNAKKKIKKQSVTKKCKGLKCYKNKIKDMQCNFVKKIKHNIYI
jgi:hypothetical protein